MLRSALCLKLHAFNDTGAIIAAATTSIPEAIGSGRTWDYRFCWLRDAAFVVEALRRLSHLSEGEAFVRFLREHGRQRSAAADVRHHRQARPARGDPADLRGYDGVGPVRIGNAAYIQRQHDVDGEMVLCLETILTDPRVVWEDPTLAPLLERLVEEAIASSTVVDTGLWEYRTQPRHYTFSKAMCWVAAHRGAELAEFLGMPERAREWRAWADDEAADHPRPRLQQGARLLHAGLRRRPARRVEPAAAGDRVDRSAPIRGSARRCAPTKSCWRRTG